MKKKKGFTLVELVAVIALLAVILLLVIPNIVNIFNAGKKTAFSTLVQDIYKQAEKDYSVNHTMGGRNSIFCDSVTYYDLDGSYYCERLSFNDETARYFVSLTEDGKVDYIIVGNKEYCYDGPATLEIDDDYIYNDKVFVVDDGEIFCGRSLDYSIK